jgi:hypothetical protein
MQILIVQLDDQVTFRGVHLNYAELIKGVFHRKIELKAAFSAMEVTLGGMLDPAQGRIFLHGNTMIA